jgi:ribosomal protein S18 acetylase RimI-like enzyme
MTLAITRVERDKAPEILEIVQGVALWLKGKGIDQWSTFLDAERARMTIERRFDEGEVFLGSLDGVAVATITLQWEDAFWGDLGKDPAVGYIHTMAVSRDHAGRGLGRELLDWTAAYFAKAGRTKVRLDCIEENFRLCRFYDAAGYRTIARKDWEGEQLVMKERRLT